VTDLVKGPGQAMYGFGFYYSTSFFVYSPRIYFSSNGGSSWSLLSPNGLGNLKIGSRGGVHNGFLYFDGTDTYDYDLVFKSALPTAPLVSTAGVTDILDISAVCGGSVTSTEQIISRGLCWNTTGTPTITDPKANTSAVTGSFTLNLTGLSPNTTYYVRAFASNFVGITYGNEQTFTTLDFSGIRSFEKEKALEVYPVPSSDFVYLKWNAKEATKEYSIYDVTGRVVLSSLLKQGENQIDIRDLPAGVYYLSVEGYGGVRVFKQ